jgi:hypothetical protein
MNRYARRLSVVVLVLVIMLNGMIALAQDGGEKLTETFVTKDGTLLFDYPAGWHAEEYTIPGFSLLGTSAEVVEAMFYGDVASAPPPGDMVMFLVSPQAAGIMFNGEIPTSAEDALEFIMADEEGQSEFGEPETITVGDYTGLVVPASGPEGDGLAAVVDFDGRYVLISAIAAPGGFGEFEATAHAIINSIVLRDPQGTIRFEDDSPTISFDYPAGWLVFEGNEGNYAVMNTFIAADVPGPGQVMIAITTPTGLATYGVTSESGATADLVASVFADSLLMEGDKALSDPVAVSFAGYDGQVDLSLTA